MSQLNNYQIGFYAVIAIVSCIIIVYIVRYTIKQIPEDTFKKSQGKPEGPSEPDTSILESWKSIPEWLQKMILVFVLLFAVYLLFFMAPNKQPVYKQVIEKETILNEGEFVEFKIAKGDSVHFSTKDLPHLVVWQGFNEQHGESRHYSGKDWIEIFSSSRVIRVYPCKEHEVYGGTLFYTIYRK